MDTLILFLTRSTRLRFDDFAGNPLDVRVFVSPIAFADISICTPRLARLGLYSSSVKLVQLMRPINYKTSWRGAASERVSTLLYAAVWRAGASRAIKIGIIYPKTRLRTLRNPHFGRLIPPSFCTTPSQSTRFFAFVSFRY